MITAYTYSYANDFGSNLHEGQLHVSIARNANINTDIISVQKINDIVKIKFLSDLSSSELSILNNLIQNHVPTTPPRVVTEYNISSSDPTIPPPQSGDKYYNTLINHEMRYDQYRGKWLSVTTLCEGAGRNGSTSSGVYYRRFNGMRLSATLGPPVAKGTIVRIGYSTSNMANHTLEILVGGQVVASLASGGAKSKSDDNVNADFNAGVMSFRNKTGSNSTTYFQCIIYYKLRV